MNVRWNAVLLGVAIDFCLTLVLQLVLLILGMTEPFEKPDLGRIADLAVLGLGLLATVVGGYAAGSSAGEARVFNGFMVGVVDIVLLALLNSADQQGNTQQIFVFVQLIGCVAGAMGGYLSQFKPRSVS